MSIRAIHAVWSLPEDVAVTSSGRLVLLALADHANDDGTCWPGVSTVAAKAGLSERSVRRHLVKLKAANLIALAPRRRADGSQTSNFYRLSLPGLSSPPDGPVSPSPDSRGTPIKVVQPSKEPSTKAVGKRVLNSRRVSWDETSGRFVGIVPDDIRRWSDTFAAVDVAQEIKRIEAYAVANPRWRKSNWLRTITNWLGRAQDGASSESSGESPSTDRVGRLVEVVLEGADAD